jgi:hypothetical protein
MDELVEECFLHLPLGDPTSFVHAALVCKRWRRILADRGFHRRFRELHHGRTPSMLGFFHVSKRTGACFTPTSSFCPHNADDLNGRRAIDSHHDRVLLASPPLLSNLTVWDPITGEQVDLLGLHLPQCPCQFCFFNSRAAVLCAASNGACHHVDCHSGHFVIVLMHTYHHKVYAVRIKQGRGENGGDLGKKKMNMGGRGTIYGR